MRPTLPALLLLLPGVALAGARASHIKVDSNLGKSFYQAGSAIDGKMETCWMVPGESENVGEWIEVEVPKSEVDKVAIFPGNGKTEESFGDYARVKTVRVDVFSFDDDHNEKQVGSTVVEVADKAEMQIVDIPNVKLPDGLFGGKVRFTVMDVYQGEDYPSVAVSEIGVILAEVDAKPKVTDMSGAQAGHDSSMALDDNPKTWFAGGPEVVVTVDPIGFAVSSVGFAPAGKDWGRVKKVEVEIGGIKRVTEVPDALTGMTWVPAPVVNGFNGGGFGEMHVKVLEVYPGTNAGLGVSELKFKATTYEPI